MEARRPELLEALNALYEAVAARAAIAARGPRSRPDASRCNAEPVK